MAGTFAHIPCIAVVNYAWLVFLVVWLIGALRTKRTRARQPKAARVLQVALGLCIWLLVAIQHYPVHLLERTVLPATPIFVVLGYLLLLGGIAFAIVARVSLGRNWSANVTLKEGHQLICTGLYSIVRNPIYTGITAQYCACLSRVRDLHPALYVENHVRGALHGAGVRRTVLGLPAEGPQLHSVCLVARNFFV
jgi:protein-S-isoprenylcysteine O-methyltransferase Ste14